VDQREGPRVLESVGSGEFCAWGGTELGGYMSRFVWIFLLEEGDRRVFYSSRGATMCFDSVIDKVIYRMR
jgi:hypothetical protein